MTTAANSGAGPTQRIEDSWQMTLWLAQPGVWEGWTSAAAGDPIDHDGLPEQWQKTYELARQMVVRARVANITLPDWPDPEIAPPEIVMVAMEVQRRYLAELRAARR